MLKKLFASAILLFASCIAFSQSADAITQILNTERLTYGQAAYLSQSALSDDISEEEAFLALEQSGVIKKKFSASDEITLKKFAQICSKTWSVEGSLFLKIFKNQRYAFRQMKADDVIPSDADPHQKISGHEALNIITNCIEIYELKNGGEE